jgi:putative phosphonoacetaldehyde dehydrogenase
MINAIFKPLRIGGDSIQTVEQIAVINPYTGKPAGAVASATRQHMQQAIATASGYEAHLTRHERSQILLKAAHMIGERAKSLAQQVVAETGLCLKDARNEVCRTQDVLALASSLCLQEDADVYAGDVTSAGKARKTLTFREPVTAIGVITPFNHPLCQVAHKVAPGIATNNCIVLKPSEKTPISAYDFAEILFESGLPPEMLSVVTGPAVEMADELVHSEKIEVLAFTGSTAVGRILAQNATYKRLLLELGGNDALIVLPDANLDDAADLAVRGAFGNSGQRCTAIKRILIADEKADEFASKVVERAAKLVCGDPNREETDVGTVIDENSARIIEQRVTDAINDGARLLLGHQRQGALYYPTVLDKVSPESTLVAQETFGPVAPIIRFKEIDEAVQIVNGTEFGLSAGVCTNHWPSALQFIRRLKVGSINIGEIPSYRTEMTPFGGIKGSGLGHKEGLVEAMRFYTNVKAVSVPWFG